MRIREKPDANALRLNELYPIWVRSRWHWALAREVNCVEQMMSSRVYVVDDEPSVRASIVDLLDSMGIATASFDSAEAFLAKYSQTAEARQCVLADFRMPGLNGLELKRELNARNCDVPVILLTGYRDHDTDLRAEELGVFAILEKPFPPPELQRLTCLALNSQDP